MNWNHVELEEIEIVDVNDLILPRYRVEVAMYIVACFQDLNDAKHFLAEKLPFKVRFHKAGELDAMRNEFWILENVD